jgi:hypothetical protein
MHIKLFNKALQVAELLQLFRETVCLIDIAGKDWYLIDYNMMKTQSDICPITPYSEWLDAAKPQRDTSDFWIDVGKKTRFFDIHSVVYRTQSPEVHLKNNNHVATGQTNILIHFS